MDVGQEAQVPEAQIAVHWRVEDCYDPLLRFTGQANAEADEPVVVPKGEDARASAKALLIGNF